MDIANNYDKPKRCMSFFDKDVVFIVYGDISVDPRPKDYVYHKPFTYLHLTVVSLSLNDVAILIYETNYCLNLLYLVPYVAEKLFLIIRLSISIYNLLYYIN